MKILTSILLVVFLAGCLSIPTSEVERRCFQINTLYAAFIAFSASGDVSASSRAKARTLYNAAQAICSDPASLSSDQALVRLAEAYAAIRLEMKGK